MNPITLPVVPASALSGAAVPAVSPGVSPSNTSFPISFAQRRLWLLEQLQPGSGAYNLPVVWGLEGPLNQTAFERSLNQIIRRHASLRTTFRLRDDEPRQEIAAFTPVPLPRTDLSLAHDPEAEARRLIAAEVSAPFDLEKGPVFRLALLRLTDAHHLFVFNAHHIAWDGWSINVIRNELTSLYSAFCNNEPSSLPELTLQYAELAAEQHGSASASNWQEHLEYWRQQLRDPRPALEVPSSKPRPERPSFQGAVQTCRLDKTLVASLRALSRQNGATLFMTVLAAFKALLHRFTGQQDILIGSPVAGRDSPGSEHLIGFFVNTVALRTDLSGDPSFPELLQRVRRVTLDAYAHQDVPFDRVVQELHPERNLADPDPLIQVVMGFESGAVHEWEMGGLRVAVMDIDLVRSKFDWTFLLEEVSGEIRAHLEYSTDLFEPDTIQRFLQHFQLLLEGIAENAQRPLSEFPLMRAAERLQLLDDWNQTATEYEHDACVHKLFEAQAAKTPSATALVFNGREMTYAELDLRASELARRLRQHGVKPRELVGVSVERSFEVIIALLGILKTGAAYVPLDRAYPRERLAFMLEDTALAIVVADVGFELPPSPRALPKVIRVAASEPLRVPALQPASAGTDPAATADDLAYVMYTSGSTGVPKGVAVPHRAVVRLVRNTSYVTFARGDVFLQLAPISFDASTFEIWGCLLNGAKLVIAPPNAPSLDELGRAICEHNITTLWLTAGLFHQMVDHHLSALKGVRQLLAGGDILSVPHILKTIRELPQCRLINGYGPTENTTFSCCFRVPPDWPGARSVPIGRPISNTQVYILDKNLAPTPVGVPGELCVAGDGLARGYWNRPALTAERFIPNPFDATKGSLLYKTGDTARYLPDGNIEFLGRKDQQIKLRGFRIELGEIETTLSQHPGIRECAVALRGQKTSEPRLAAYFVSTNHRPPSPAELRRFLEKKLPQYMLPSHFIELTSLPLTQNGKLDRNALPEPGSARPDLEKKYASPRDEIELELTRIWENSLSVHPIGIEDKFFDLGGHSLMAVRVLAQIEKAFGKKLRLSTLFQASTIEQLAGIIREETQEGRVSKGTSLVEIQSRGSRPPLFLVHGAGGGMFWGYVNLSRQLGLEQPVYGFRSRGLDGKDEFRKLEDMAAQYVADLRRVQPHGPYQLGGYCFGGTVAYEMAHQLAAAGEQIRVLALINCSPPNSAYERPTWTPLWFARFFRNLIYWTNHYRQLTPAQRRNFFQWKYRIIKTNFTALLRSSSSDAAAVAVENLVDLSLFSTEQQSVWQIHISAQAKYQPQPFPGPAHIFRSPGHSVFSSFDPTYGWRKLVRRGVQTFIIPAAHETILQEPFVGQVAKSLNALLQPENQPATSNEKPPLHGVQALACSTELIARTS